MGDHTDDVNHPVLISSSTVLTAGDLTFFRDVLWRIEVTLMFPVSRR